MLSSVNKVTLLGIIGDKIELRHLENGGAICRFSICTFDSFTDKTSGKKKQVGDWHNVTTWGEQAKEIYKTIQKGQQLYLEAKLKSRTWQSKEGITHRGYELFLESYLPINSETLTTAEKGYYSKEGIPDPPTPLPGFELSDLDELPF